MATINTAVGTMQTSELGFTLPHEHLIDSSAGIRISYGELELRDQVYEMAVKDFSRAKDGGVDTIVEVSPMDLGRDVELMKEVSLATGVNFICSTGSWLDIPRSLWWRDKEFIADFWVKDVEVGMDGTDIKAGMIKVATNDPISEHEELMFRAAARTHLRTGVPITTHTPPMSRIGERQVQILMEEGVEPQNIYVGHINQTLDPDYHRELARLGVWLGWDINNEFGRPHLPQWEDRAVYLKELLDEGIGDNMMMSHDWNVVLSRIGLVGFPTREENPEGFLWLSHHFIPRLMELGVSQEVVDRMMIENPRRHFESVKPAA